MKRDSAGKILLGLATGTVFGFLLHKGRAGEYKAIGGTLRGEDSSVLKIMATASAVGALGTHVLNDLGVVDLKVKPLNLGGVVVGGTVFGAGMAILGYCPGTSMAALGEGHKDAFAGALGMFAGALTFVRFYPYLKKVMEKGELGEKTLPEVTGTSPWLWVAGTSAAVAAGAGLLETR
jgi:uncharacterized protein